MRCATGRTANRPSAPPSLPRSRGAVRRSLMGDGGRGEAKLNHKKAQSASRHKRHKKLSPTPSPSLRLRRFLCGPPQGGFCAFSCFNLSCLGSRHVSPASEFLGDFEFHLKIVTRLRCPCPGAARRAKTGWCPLVSWCLGVSNLLPCPLTHNDFPNVPCDGRQESTILRPLIPYKDACGACECL
jgi:hypothetical protein